MLHLTLRSRGLKEPRPHENFEALQILSQYAWTEKVRLHKKSRRKINYRYFKPLRSPGSHGPQAHTFF